MEGHSEVVRLAVSLGHTHEMDEPVIGSREPPCLGLGLGVRARIDDLAIGYVRLQRDGLLQRRRDRSASQPNSTAMEMGSSVRMIRAATDEDSLIGRDESRLLSRPPGSNREPVVYKT